MSLSWTIRIWKSRLSYPSNVVLILNVLSLVLYLITKAFFPRSPRGRTLRRWARRVIFWNCALLALLVLLRADERLLAPLEGRVLRTGTLPEEVTGIVLLGGAECIGLSEALGEPVFNEEGQRIMKVLELAIRYPQARVCLTGGKPDNNPRFPAESELSWAALQRYAFPNASRVLLEKDSHNTLENVLFLKDLVHPEPGQTWVVVSSAYHLPRALGTFQQYWPGTFLPAGTNFRTGGESPALFTSLHFEVGKMLQRVDMAVREYLALLFYSLRGHTTQLFPSTQRSDL